MTEQIHEHRGERRRVLKHGPEGVTFDRPDAPHEPPQTVSRGAWLEWTRPAAAFDFEGKPIKGKRLARRDVAHRDPKPATPRPLSPRDIAALLTLHGLRDGSGRVPAALGTLLEAAQLSAPAWERAVASLKARGLLRTWCDDQGHYKVRRYELTPTGLAAAAGTRDDVGAKSSEVVPKSSPKSSRSRTGSGSNSNGEAKETRTTTTGDDSAPTSSEVVPKSSGEVVSGLEALLARALDVIEEQARVIAELSGRARAAPAPSSQEPPTTTENPPCKACGAPTEVRAGEHGPFLGCSRFPDCRETSSLRAPAAASPKRARRKDDDLFRAAIERAANEPPVSLETLPKIQARMGAPSSKRKPEPVGEVVGQILGATPGRGA